MIFLGLESVKFSATMATKIKGALQSAFKSCRRKGLKPEPENLDHCNHEKALLLEFYQLKNFGHDVGSIDGAEVWVRGCIVQSEENLGEWEAYLRNNETEKLAKRRIARKKHKEEQKIATAKKTLANARREILWLMGVKKVEKAVDWPDAFQLKAKAQLLGAGGQDEPPQNMVEGPLQPDWYVTIERKPDQLRPLGAP
jgi:hypothetical protein